MPYRRKKLTFAISSPDEFLYRLRTEYTPSSTGWQSIVYHSTCKPDKRPGTSNISGHGRRWAMRAPVMMNRWLLKRRGEQTGPRARRCTVEMGKSIRNQPPPPDGIDSNRMDKFRFGTIGAYRLSANIETKPMTDDRQKSADIVGRPTKLIVCHRKVGWLSDFCRPMFVVRQKYQPKKTFWKPLFLSADFSMAHYQFLSSADRHYRPILVDPLSSTFCRLSSVSCSVSSPQFRTHFSGSDWSKVTRHISSIRIHNTVRN